MVAEGFPIMLKLDTTQLQEPTILSRSSSRGLFALIFTLMLVSCAVAAAGNRVGDANLRLAATLSATVWQAAIDDDSRYLVTSTSDKAVTLWPLKYPGEPISYYFPIRKEEEKRAHAVAMSSDSKLIAYGVPKLREEGRESARIYIVNRLDGSIVQVIDDLPSRAQALSFSADGKYLAASLSDGYCLRIWSTESWSLLARYDGSEMAGSNQLAVIFRSDRERKTKNVLLGGTRGIWIFGPPPNFQLQKKLNYEEVSSLSLSPDGHEVAVGINKGKSVKIINIDESEIPVKEFEPPPELKSDYMSISRVMWSKNGRCVFGGGTIFGTQPNDESYQMKLLVWNTQEMRPPKVRDAGSDIIRGIVPYGNNGALLVTQEPIIYGYDCNGDKLKLENNDLTLPIYGNSLDLRDTKHKYPIWTSNDGQLIAFRPFRREQMVLFDVNKGVLRIINNDDGEMLQKLGLRKPVFQSADFVFDNIENSELNFPPTLQPRLNGKRLELNRYDISRNSAVSEAEKMAVWGTSDTLRLLRNDASEKWSLPIAKEAYRVTFSGDGRLIIVGHSDGTIRWYNTETGERLLTLFIHADLKHWVLWMKGGYYNTSVDGESLLGWVINDKSEKSAVYYDVGRFRKGFYVPEATKSVLVTRDETEAVHSAMSTRGGIVEDSQNAVIAEHSATVGIVFPDNGEKFYTPELEIGYVLLRANDVPVQSVEVSVNGERVESSHGPFDYMKLNRIQIEIPESLRVKDRDIEIGIRTETKFGQSGWSTRTVKWEGRTAQVKTKPKLWGLLVGISKYPNYSGNKIEYADDDAKDLKEFFERKSKAFIIGDLHLVPEDDASKDRVIQELTWLRLKAKFGDTVIIYIAGHGLMFGGEYYFLTKEVNPSELQSVLNDAISGSTLRAILKEMSGRKLLFVDTCREKWSDPLGIVDPVWLQNTTHDNKDAMLFLASEQGELAYEDLDYGSDGYGGHGLFTRVLLDGLNGRADKPFADDPAPDHNITIAEIKRYIADRFEKINNGGDRDGLKLKMKDAVQYPEIDYPPSSSKEREYAALILATKTGVVNH